MNWFDIAAAVYFISGTVAHVAIVVAVGVVVWLIITSTE